MIFIAICAYRETELVPTVLDCIANARWPDDLRVGICNQNDDGGASIDRFRYDPHFRIDNVPWEESQGLGWARARVQKLYNGEEFAIQLDGHHRFAPEWDAQLIGMLESCGSAKPILGSYAGMYDPVTNRKLNDDPYQMVADKFTPSGTIMFRPQTIPGWKDLTRPVRARFASGHFTFSTGRFWEEVPADPLIFFGGEEISMSIRGFTNGWDLFHPHRLIVWHEYTREGRAKIWDDHTRAAGFDLAWHDRDSVSKARIRKLLREEDNDSDLTGFDLGTTRTHAEFEAYSGIDFAKRELSGCARRGVPPPCLDGTDFRDGEWLASYHCHSRAHCTACRHSESFRASLLRSGMVETLDFKCEWGEDPPDNNDGPGTRLMRYLRRLGFHAVQGCGCHLNARRMNAWGDSGCIARMEEILDVMEKAASQPKANPMGIPWSESGARALVLRAARQPSAVQLRALVGR